MCEYWRKVERQFQARRSAFRGAWQPIRLVAISGALQERLSEIAGGASATDSTAQHGKRLVTSSKLPPRLPSVTVSTFPPLSGQKTPVRQQCRYVRLPR